MPIIYDGIRFDEAFRSDLVVRSKVIVELESVEQLTRLHAKQLLTQLRLSGLKLGSSHQLRRNAFEKWIKRIINGQLDDDDEPPEVTL